MATGKAPWSQQYQEVAALFYIGTTKSHPPIPDHLSAEAKDFLLKCLQKEPDLRATASELLKHPFVAGENRESHLGLRSSLVDSSGKRSPARGFDINESMNVEARRSSNSLKNVGDLGGVSCLTIHPEFPEGGSLWQPVDFEDDMCRIDDIDDLALGASMKFQHTLLSSDCNQSFNPMCEPNDDWPYKFDGSPKLNKSGMEILPSQTVEPRNTSLSSIEIDSGFTFPKGQSAPVDDDEVLEAKIRAFLDDKAVELKKLQTPLYEFYNSLNVAGSPSPLSIGNKENFSSNCNLPPKSRSPNKVGIRLSTALDVEHSSSPRRFSRRVSNISEVNLHASPVTPRTRELMRQAGAAKTSSPKDRILNRPKDPLRFASPGK